MSATSMVPTAIYHRCSTLDQDPELARHELRAAALARGLKIVMEVEETGSGARNDRPGLQRVLAAARKGALGAVVVWKLDRWGRSALDVLTNIEELERSGVRFIATSQGLDIRSDGDPMSKLILTVLAGVASFELSLIRERTKLGLAKARAAGKHIGRPRKGNVANGDEVGQLRLQGNSWSTIAQKIGCTPSAARRAWQTGVPKRGPQGVEIAAAAPPCAKGSF